MPAGRVLIRKAIANLRDAPLQSLLIVLIVAGSAAAVALALILWRNSADPWQRAFDRANGPHAIIYANEPTAGLSEIATQEGVAAAVGPYPMTRDLELVSGEVRASTILLGLPTETPAVGRPLLAAGRWLAAGGESEVVIDASLARELDIHLGDRVEIDGATGPTPLTVVGMAITAWRGVYPEWNPTVLYLRPETVTALAGGDPGSFLFVRLSDPEASGAFIDQALRDLPQGSVCCATDWRGVRDDIGSYNHETALILGMLSFFALAAVSFVLANTIGGRVLTQRREIALLKAVGCTPGQIALLLLVEHLILGLVGAVLGVFGGFAAARFFLDRIANPFDSEPIPNPDLWLLGAILLGVLLLVAISTLVPAWYGSRISAAAALTPRRRTWPTRPSLPAKLAAGLRLPPTIVIGIKDIFNRPVRTWLAVGALTMTVATATFTLGAEATIGSYLDGSIWAANPPELTVDRISVPNEEMRHIIDAAPAVAGYLTRTQQSMKLGDRSRWINVNAVGGDVAGVGLRIPEGRLFAGPGEAVAGQGLLDLTGLDVGDDLSLVVADAPLTVRIVGRYVEFDNNGEMLTIGMETLQTVVPAALPDEYDLQLAAGAAVEPVRSDLIQATNGRADVALTEAPASPREILEVRSALYGVGVILLLIGVIDVATVSLLGVRERTRDIGALKAIGLTPRQIIFGEIAGMSLLALFAVAIGIPLGEIAGPAFFDVMATEQGIGKGLAVPTTWWWLLPLLPGAIAVAALGGAIPARLAGRLPIAEALRAE